MSRGVAAVLALCAIGHAGAGHAEERATAPEEVGGIAEPAREPADAGKSVANALLFVPRTVIDFLFRGTAAAAGLVADQQLVPRYRELLGAPGGDIFVFPTLFAETGSPVSVGLRMIADSKLFATSQRVGYGGRSDVEVESRVLFKGGGRLPYVISAELYYKLEDELEYHGLGLRPRLDPRNHYRARQDFGLYTERHLRGLGTLGLRLSDDFEFFLSASLARRQVYDDDDAGAEALSAVFEPSTVPGRSADTFIGYAEMAARFDSRPLRTKPSPGVLLEAYVGGARDTMGDPVAFMRVGWRAAGFLSIYRRTNVFGLRAVFDRLVPLGGLEPPFNQLPRQPDFRGFDTRRDFVSMVGSADYTWQLLPFMGMRAFVDVASVAPSVSGIGLAQLEHARYAAGLGVDFFSDTSEVARVTVSTGPEGARLLLSIGVPDNYGDRQHRE